MGSFCLDDMFNRVNSVLATGINQGATQYVATTTVEVATSVVSLATTKFVLFEPDRSKTLTVRTPNIFDSILLTTFDPMYQATVAFKRSSYGPSIEIDSLGVAFSITTDEEMEDVDLYDNEGGIISTAVEAITPKYILKEITRTIKLEIPLTLARLGEGKGDSRVRAAVTKSRVKSKVSKKQLTLEEK